MKSDFYLKIRKTRECQDISECIFKAEEEHDNNPSIQWIRENSLTVNINSKRAEYGPHYDSVVRYLRIE